MRQFVLKYYLLFPLSLLCCFYTFKSFTFPIHDFANYYFGAQFLAEGSFSATTYLPFKFNKEIFDLGHTAIFVSFAPNTPFLATFFLPFTVFPVVQAKLLFNIISSFLFIFSCFRLFDFYKINLKYLILIPILFIIPIKNNLLFGQVYFLIFFLLAESLIAYEKQRTIKMAFFLSIAILLKIFPVIFILVFLFKKQLKPLLLTGIFCFLFLMFSLYFTGVDVWLFFLKTILPGASNGEITTAFVDNYQSVFMFLKRLLVFDATENPTAFLNYPRVFFGLILGIKIAIVLMGYQFIKEKSNNLVVFSYFVITSYFISPYGSTYGFILLLFVLFSVLKLEGSFLKKITLLVLIFILNTIPNHFFLENAFPFSYFKLFVFLMIFALFIFQISKSFQWKLLLPIVIIPIVFQFFDANEKNKSTYFLENKSPILIYNYTIENQQLTYYYWNENGENIKTMPFSYNQIEVINDINEKSVIQKALKFERSNKLNPILIDNKYILYLSDFERGFGFYTLRKIKI